MRLLFVLIFVLSSSVAHAAEIRFKNEPIRCRETLVTLSDIAEIVPGPGDDVDRLRRTVLITAPVPGEETVLENVEVRDILSRSGVNSFRHRFTGAARIKLVGTAVDDASVKPKHKSSAIVPASYTYDSQTPSGGIQPALARSNTLRQNIVSPQLLRTLEQQVTEALIVYLNHKTASDNSKAETLTKTLPWKITLKLSQEQGRLLATSGQIVDIFGATNPPTGKQRFGIRMQAADPTTGQNVVVTVDADVVLPQEVVVVRRSLPKGFIIGPGDVTLRRVDNLKGEEFFVDVKEAVGRETVRSIGETSALTPAMLRRPTLVCKGDIVTIRAVNGGITVRTEVTALADGCEGDTIPVETINPNQSKRVRRGQTDTASFLARVSGPKSVEVFATGNLVTDLSQTNYR